MIRFGAWSTALGMAAGFGALVALLLLCAPRQRSAQRLLAALLCIAVLRLMPYVLGFAGAYDAWPWLSFAPFDLPLALGPLLYLYVLRLATPTLPPRWGRHFIAPGMHLAYQLWAFALPLARKNAWNSDVHAPWIAPLLDVTGAVSLAVYLLLAWRLRGRYLRWLREHVSDVDAQRQPWIASVLIALSLWLALSTGFDLSSYLFNKLNYYDRFPEYLAFAAIVLWLGLEGWRHADRPFPQMVSPPAPSGPGRDWHATALDWRAQIDRAGWWRQPGLTLTEIARLLGTNETYVSRAFNTGLGQNFNAAINNMRVKAVQSAMLGAPAAELLDLALACGFSSKASFNRVFREQTGMTPSAWRTSQSLKIVMPPDVETTPPTDAA